MMQSIILPIIVQAVAGIVGGQAVGAAFKGAAMGQITKILAGAVGGVGGGALLTSLGGDTGALSGLLGHAVGGVAGGGVLSGIVGAVLSATKKTS
ncbi:hypothetical protein [Chelativorans sp. YIM 93263]|uniref:hypothetical protein n=1 Tax=Chelativorans sp. YIM 93263 TaxID=2906648 RepID=UPI0023796ECA|nr:hypothetical protein [Chelativorans sp. YIM 93263]